MLLIYVKSFQIFFRQIVLHWKIHPAMEELSNTLNSKEKCAKSDDFTRFFKFAMISRKIVVSLMLKIVLSNHNLTTL